VTSPEARKLEQEAVASLVRAALGGDQDAFRQLVERKRDLVFRVAHHHLGNVDDAREVAQGVFVRVWRNLHSYDPSRAFDTWLYQVTANAAIDHHRRKKARPVETSFDDVRLQAGEATGRPPLDSLEVAELGRVLHEVSGVLGERQRLAFYMREVEGLPTRDVAAALGTTESTVRNHVFQARKLLREALRQRYPEYARDRADGDGAPS
jgi:RNA polymerase sigma-70 factor (ECF subfamily)